MIMKSLPMRIIYCSLNRALGFSMIRLQVSRFKNPLKSGLLLSSSHPLRVFPVIYLPNTWTFIARLLILFSDIHSIWQSIAACENWLGSILLYNAWLHLVLYDFLIDPLEHSVSKVSMGIFLMAYSMVMQKSMKLRSSPAEVVTNIWHLWRCQFTHQDF